MTNLGVLDIGPIEHALELSVLAEELGFHRYWIAEHQPQPSPMLMASLIAGQTDRIRVGTAGILFHYYPPLRTAHDFHLLERAYSGRIDAGFCGGMTIKPELMEPDRDGRDYAAIIRDYPGRVERLVRALRNTPDHPGFDPATAWAGVGYAPQLWSLGGGARSAALAARLGLNFGYALMFTSSVDDPASVRSYREQFVPHPGQDAPLVAVAVGGICADTEARARAAADAYTNKYFLPRFIGDGATVATGLAELRERFDADEVVFCDLGGALEVRRAGLTALAAAWRTRAG